MGVPNVPIIVWRCVEEVERRGLDIIGLYRLCGSATKKRILREAFERNARSVNLSPDNVPDINVITGVLKDYLRELPEPLFTKCLYQMMVDALAVCLPDDPQGNAKLMFSILDCLPKVNRCTLIYLLDHLAMVVSQCNKMSPASLAVCFGPVLMLHSEENGPPLDFQQPIAVLKYLLEIWPVKSDSSEDFFSRFSASSSYASSRAQQQSAATAAAAAATASTATGTATGTAAVAGNIGAHRAALAASTLTSSTAPNYGTTRSSRVLHSTTTTGQASTGDSLVSRFT
uniref:Rho GTPase-activating protein 100F n=2 Tax=Apis cerana TaxID=7461 RepID=V9IJ26_APICE